MSIQCLLADTETATGRPRSGLSVRIHLRFLQLQTRTVERYDGQGDCFVPVEELVVGDDRWLSWDEAVEQEAVLDLSAEELHRGTAKEVAVDGGEDVEVLAEASGGSPHGPVAGRIVRRRRPLHARVTGSTTQDDGHTRLEVRVDNISPEPPDTEVGSRDAAICASLIGAHLILEAEGGRFVSVVDPPETAAAAARGCLQRRCWPVLAGEKPADGEAATSTVVLGSPIILYDFPEVAEQSAGALFDSTEIDEILTLRVMTMTDEEKAEARATDPRAREIIDRCDRMSPSSLQQLHGILRNPHAIDPTPAGVAGMADLRDVDPPTFGDPEVPWWDPSADAAVRPDLDSVSIDGVPVSKGSLVRVHPSRRADAQDLFFADRVARVTAVLSDVDGGVHVALVLEDDPAADLHDWYGRYWYFAPDELEPLPDRGSAEPPTEHREESRS